MKVIIVGAGPSGLLLSLLLAKNGISVQLLERAATLDKQPRATHYSIPATCELERAGVLKEMYQGGFVPDGVKWRKLDGSPLTGLTAKGVIPEDFPYRMVCYPLDRLCPLLLRHVEQMPNVSVHWLHPVARLYQDDDSASVEVQTGESTFTMSADYVIGCDGARSAIRRQLFGDEFPGFTWNEQIVATNTYYDFDQFGWSDSNFIVHPEHYFMAARISPHRGKNALWRVTYGEKSGLKKEELLARRTDKFRTFLPGHPEPDKYEVINFSPYIIHQRCVDRMRVGRVLLAADAAHLCNPFGGMGLTGGIADVGSLADCLIAMKEGLATSAILEHYDRVRREIWHKTINPISSENLTRLNSQDPETALENDPFFQVCKRAEQDKQFSCELQLSVGNLLKHDFSQYHTAKQQAQSALSNGEDLVRSDSLLAT